VFKNVNGNWYQDAYLKASNAGYGDRLGQSVAISGNTILAGATGEDNQSGAIDNTDGAAISDTGTAFDSGAGYIFLLNTNDTLNITYNRLPDTGQTIDYSATEGEDSDYTINPLSYLDNLDGTVTDEVTNLMWQKCVVGFSDFLDCTGGSATLYNWYRASGTYHATENWATVDVCGNLSLAGHEDWRLPNITELTGIVDYGRYSPTIDTSVFPTDDPYGPLWSSTASASSTGFAWQVSFYVGEVGHVGWTPGKRVRCVRGGQ